MQGPFFPTVGKRKQKKGLATAGLAVPLGWGDGGKAGGLVPGSVVP